MWRCPNCKSEIRIFGATTTVLVYEDGCEQDDGFEWEDNNGPSAPHAIGAAQLAIPRTIQTRTNVAVPEMARASS